MSAPLAAQHAGVAEGVRLTRVARSCLYGAILRFDDAGYTCEALSDNYTNVAELIADWSGRPRRRAESATFIAAAIEWRRQNGRTY